MREVLMQGEKKRNDRSEVCPKKKKEIARRPPVSPDQGCVSPSSLIALQQHQKKFARSKDRVPPGEVVAVVIQATAVETGRWSSSVQEGGGGGGGGFWRRSPSFQNIMGVFRNARDSEKKKYVKNESATKEIFYLHYIKWLQRTTAAINSYFLYR